MVIAPGVSFGEWGFEILTRLHNQGYVGSTPITVTNLKCLIRIEAVPGFLRPVKSERYRHEVPFEILAHAPGDMVRPLAEVPDQNGYGSKGPGNALKLEQVKPFALEARQPGLGADEAAITRRENPGISTRRLRGG